MLPIADIFPNTKKEEEIREIKIHALWRAKSSLFANLEFS